MNDKSYIIKRILGKHAIPLMLLLVVMALFFVNVMHPIVVYGQEQVANVECEFNVEENNVQNLVYYNQFISDKNQLAFNFGDLDIKLTKKSHIVTNIIVENISSCYINVALSLNDLVLNNMRLNIYVNDVAIENNNFCEIEIKANERVNIKIILQIDNVAQNAVFNGSLNLYLS